MWLVVYVPSGSTKSGCLRPPWSSFPVLPVLVRVGGRKALGSYGPCTWVFPEIGLGYMLFQVLGALMVVNPTSSAAGRIPGSLVAITHFPDTRGRLGLSETAQDCMPLFLNAVHPDLSPDDSGGRYNTRDIEHCQGPLTLWLRHLR